MRVRVAAGWLVVLMLAVVVPLALATGASAQSLHCGAGGAGGTGYSGGWGDWVGATGGSGIAPQCDQNTNGDATPTMNCWAGGDAANANKHEPKKKQGGAGGVAAGLGSGNVSANGGSEPDSRGGLAVGTGTGSATANGRAGAGGTALGIGSGTADANGGRKGKTYDGRPGNGGDGIMPLCSQNVTGDPGPQASSSGSGGDVLGMFASRFAIGGPTIGVATATASGRKLAATGDSTDTQIALAGLAFILGGLIVLGFGHPARRRSGQPA
jgi:LPXTG-motif cell wall-anchored protein